MSKYARMYYIVEMVGGEKMVHYETFLVENGGCPDDWDEDEWWRSSDGQTSVDIVDLTFAYFKASDVARYLKSGELFAWLDEVESLAFQYMERVSQGKADEYIERAEQTDEWKELDIIDVTEDTPCGCYWSRGWWTFDEEAE